MNEQKQINLLNKNMILSLLFIVSVFLSFLISYNEKLSLEGKKQLFDDEISKILNLSNRIFAVILVLGFLEINKQGYNIGKETNVNIRPLQHQLWASYLTLASSLLALYVVYENLYQNFQVFNTENPTV